MNFKVHSTSDIQAVATDSLLVFYTESKELPQELAALDKALGGELTALFADKEATGKLNTVVHVRSNGRIAAKHLYLAGLGEAAKVDGEAVRAAAGTAARSLRGEHVAAVLFDDQYAVATVEGLLLGSYKYTGHKSAPADDKRFSAVTIVASGDVSAQVTSAQINAEAVNFVRNYVNEPANLLHPVSFAERAAELAAQYGWDAEIIDEQKMEELSMNLILSVGKGSDIPPRMVALRYNGAPDSKEVLAMVGKGVTFDTGGYIIKPEDGMGDMKTDMAGAACVLGALKAITEKKLAINVVAVLCLAENMVSGRAFKPSDVAVAFNGKTVEMIDTDCEGLLVLADGVAYAKHLGATRIVDTATLTGAVTVVLGYEASSLYGNNDAFVEQVKQAGVVAGEKMWALPNYPEYQSLIESKIADYINYSGRNAGAIAGGVFIAAFADDVPFVHIDMANTSSVKSTKGYKVEGGTGASTRTLIALAEQLAL
ncbi:MAG: leucyl aminopeptidase [Tumebacillaceae bacterium]